MKIAFFARTHKVHLCLGGLVFEVNKPAFEYLNATRTSIGIIPPHKVVYGEAFKIWGYDRLEQKDKLNG
jgi:hypothetical protein